MVSDNTSSPARAYGCGQDVPWPSTPAPVAVWRRSERKLGSAASESTWSLPQIGPRTSFFDPPVSHEPRVYDQRPDRANRAARDDSAETAGERERGEKDRHVQTFPAGSGRMTAPYPFPCSNTTRSMMMAAAFGKLIVKSSPRASS